MTTPPAGWYPDPELQGQQRYWDGKTWTDGRTKRPPSLPEPTKVDSVSRTLVSVLAIGLVLALAACGVVTAMLIGERSSNNSALESTGEGPQFTDEETTDEEPEDAVEEPEPDQGPLPDGSYSSACDYQLGDDSENSPTGYRFTADAEIENTGNIGTIYELRSRWFLAGGATVKDAKRVRVLPGKTVRVGMVHPVSSDELDAHQSYDAGETCKASVTIIETYGAVQ